MNVNPDSATSVSSNFENNRPQKPSKQNSGHVTLTNISLRELPLTIDQINHAVMMCVQQFSQTVPTF